MVKIRMKRLGRIHEATYRIVVADSRAPLDGKTIEEIGYYNPNNKEIRLDTAAVEAWVKKGAQLTPTVKSLLRRLPNAKQANASGFKVLTTKPRTKKRGPAAKPTA